MDETAIFKLSYGLFFVGSSVENKAGICVVNTVAQVTQEPLRVSVTMLKGGYTHELIAHSGRFSVGIIGLGVELSHVAHFGQNSGHTMDKLTGYEIKTDSLSNPLFDEGCIASLSCRVIRSIDLDTHTLFIADLVDAKNLTEEKPLTYADYRVLKAGGTLSPSPSAEEKAAYQCTICHYVYDGDVPFENLPEDWLCPVCKQPKNVFTKI